MKVRNLVAGLAGLGLVTAGMAVTAPAAAAARAASVPAMSGYIDTEPSVSGRTYDSAGGTPSVTSIGTGQYLVEFPNLSALSDGGGNFEVTPVQTAHNCSVASWETGTGGTLIVYVNCYLLTSLTDTYFDLSVTRAGTVSHGLLDYAWIANKNKSYTLSGKELFNSARKRSTVRHLGTGRYEVTFTGNGKVTNTGTVKVSPYGDGDGNCQAASWHGGRTATSVYVDCFTYAGHRVNRQFLLVYARSNNILGQSGVTTATAAATKPKTKSYHPSPQYDSHAGARVKVVKVSEGHYQVYFTGSEGPGGPSHGGDVQVTTIGSTFARCTPYSYSQGSTPSAYVTCYNAGGSEIYASFAVQWMVG